MKKLIIMLISAVLLFLLGAWLVIVYSNWQVFAGVFLLMWANNIGKR